MKKPKLCVDCRHYEYMPPKYFLGKVISGAEWCNHKNNKTTDLVRGHHDCRESCRDLRQSGNNRCGPTGKWWEKK